MCDVPVCCVCVTVPVCCLHSQILAVCFCAVRTCACVAMGDECGHGRGGYTCGGRAVGGELWGLGCVDLCVCGMCYCTVRGSWHAHAIEHRADMHLFYFVCC